MQKTCTHTNKQANKQKSQHWEATWTQRLTPKQELLICQCGVTEFISHALGQASCFGIVGQDNMNLLRRSWPAQNELHGFFGGGVLFVLFGY